MDENQRNFSSDGCCKTVFWVNITDRALLMHNFTRCSFGFPHEVLFDS